MLYVEVHPLMRKSKPEKQNLNFFHKNYGWRDLILAILISEEIYKYYCFYQTLFRDSFHKNWLKNWAQESELRKMSQGSLW